MTRVKVCGTTNLDDARLAVELGAWAIGMIFHPPSPRACALEDAEEIGRELKRDVEVTGVFVNRPLEELAAIADACSLTLLQLHGDEGPAYCDEAARRTGCKVMKAVQVRDGSAVKGLKAYHVDYHMLDTYSPTVRGGTGERFDWRLVPKRWKLPIVLSGGLDPENVAEAVATVKPFAVDSASGTEASPGVKDPARVKALFDAVERADQKLEAA